MDTTISALVIPTITLAVQLAKALGMQSKYALLLVLILSALYGFFAYWDSSTLNTVLAIFIQAAGAVGLYEGAKTLTTAK